MENPEIPRGERLPADTRIEIPGKSYEQELLETPIPFANKVEFLSDFVKPTSKPMTLKAIAAKLQVRPEVAERMISEVGAEAKLNSDNELIYERFTLEVIEEEIKWQELFDSLDENLSAYAIANYLAKSERWVKHTAHDLGVYPSHVNISPNRRGAVYPKSLIYMLRTLIQHAPPANDLYSMDEAEALLGRERDWIIGALKRYDLPSEIRTLAISHKRGIHMTKETIVALAKICEDIPYAGDWLTAARMGEIVNRDKKWVNAHIGQHKSLAELRRDDTGQERIHYPPQTLLYLQELIKQLPPHAGDWLTEGAIARNLGWHVTRVRKRISPYRELSEVRLTNTGNRPLVHFPPFVQDELAQFNE